MSQFDQQPDPQLLREQYRQEQEKRRESWKRPPPPEDREIRNFVVGQFVESVKSIPPEIPLRFHGGHMYDLDAILSAGELSSGADRAKTATSFDSAGQISVTTSRNIETTIGDLEKALELKAQGKAVKQAGYIDILDTEVPVGFTAIMLPETVEEAVMGENESNNMLNVKMDSNKFVCLVVSPEVVAKTTEMLAKSGHENVPCMTYEEFTQQKDQIVEDSRKRFSYIENYAPPQPRASFSISL